MDSMEKVGLGRQVSFGASVFDVFNNKTSLKGNQSTRSSKGSNSERSAARLISKTPEKKKRVAASFMNMLSHSGSTGGLTNEPPSPSFGE